MKRFLLMSAVAAFVTAAAAQETNLSRPPAEPAAAETNAAPAGQSVSEPTNAVARAATEIFSDSANFDLKTRIAVYIGHVRVKDPQLEMACGLMTARVPQSGRIDSIVAEQNVVIDATDEQGKPIHATADKAVYTYKVSESVTNEIIELTGITNPATLRSPFFNGSGNPITWNRSTHSVSGQNIHMFVEPPESRSRTNTPAPPSETK